MFDIRGFIKGLRLYYSGYVPPKPEPHKPSETDRPVFEIPENTADWEGIVWHHSATKDNPNGNDWEAIRKYHMSWRVDGNIVTEDEYKTAVVNGRSHCEKPWSDIGYHLGIERDGGKLKVKIGRPWDKVGAHAGLKGNNTFNDKYLGCCLVGSFDSAPPDEETMALCIAVTRQIMDELEIPKENVLGHREVYDKAGVPRQKTCPGTSFDLELFRSKL